LNSSRATDFITPKSDISRSFRNAVLNLAKTHAFARSLVNSGRLSLPATYIGSPLNTPDADTFTGRMAPGAVALDAPVSVNGEDDWWMAQLDGSFVLAVFCGNTLPGRDTQSALQALRMAPVPVKAVLVVAKRYDAQPGTTYLIRPDQHIAARWRAFNADAVAAAVKRATGHA
jgi:3-(3-hydroxy-phenyl)propionate hydroxylase